MYVDADGVPFSDYGEYRGLAIGRQTSILSVAERGLWYWNEFLRDNEPTVLLSYDWTRWPENREFQPDDHRIAERMFENCSRWVLEHVEHEDGFAVWKYPYPISYGTAPGWRSAHAQAVGLQLLIRAHARTANRGYVRDLEALLQAFRVPINHGGLLDADDPEAPWYEKFADADNRRPKVLNGMLFAILGLLDIADRTGNAEAHALATEGLISVKQMLPRFDLGNWTAYDIMKKPCSAHYHRIHVEQLALLAEITGDAGFATWHRKWSAYEPQA
jgi:hypothetical protein